MKTNMKTKNFNSACDSFDFFIDEIKDTHSDAVASGNEFAAVVMHDLLERTLELGTKFEKVRGIMERLEEQQTERVFDECKKENKWYVTDQNNKWYAGPMSYDKASVETLRLNRETEKDNALLPPTESTHNIAYDERLYYVQHSDDLHS